jgi:pimeloyl-ACP methyl ester carboxylesterase
MNRQATIAEATLQDGSSIELEIYGEGATLLLPVNPRPIEGEQAEQMRKYGADPALGQAFIQGLSDAFRVVAFNYDGHIMANPRPQTLTPPNLAADMLAIADTVGADRFVYYGYSWLGLLGMQLAIRTDRLSALIMGGFPPIDAPYQEMLSVTTAAYDLAGVPDDSGDEWSTSWLSKDQTQQFVTTYEALQDFDERAAQAKIACPRLCFVGSTDTIEYAEKWGGVVVSMADSIMGSRAELESYGWDVRVLEGMDHMQAMQAAPVSEIIRPWLLSKLNAIPST